MNFFYFLSAESYKTFQPEQFYFWDVGDTPLS